MRNPMFAAAEQYPEAYEMPELQEYPRREDRRMDEGVDVFMPDEVATRPDFGRVSSMSRNLAKQPLPFLVLAMERYLDSQLPRFEYQPVDFRASVKTAPAIGEPALLAGPAPVVLIPLGRGVSMRLTTTLPEQLRKDSERDLRVVMFVSLVAMLALIGGSWLGSAT